MKTIVPTHLYLPSMQIQEREYQYNYLKKSKIAEKALSFDFTFIHNGQTFEVPVRPVVKINRSNLLVNNDNPNDTLIGELVYHSSQALFPLKLSVNSYGYPKSIYNHSEILERWKSFIPRFQAYYEKGKAIKLLNEIGKLYKNSDQLIKSLQNDLFFSLFFFPFYGDYGIGRVSTIDDYGFSFISGQKIKYSLNLEIQKNYTENGKIRISIEGKSTLIEKDTISGYFLLNKDRSIHEIEISFYLCKHEEEIKIHIQETKEVAERKTSASTVFDEKEEREKLTKSRSFFVEEIENNDLPKHNIRR
ncbi:hypothetical protein QFZ37_002373 [Chryseobacterium ginsenosidimutans]|uniref:hypothetical protein n=1 Tax=Chryseobacterium ginsenosidimutans TaxID=687846 RepID=UPI002787E123|nr:hypothetical protein [Chryseobacterium ginsenosidimutans]MDQ0594004.1 hypothetical protein [Chryseobacterium ginsenosidimutans]